MSNRVATDFVTRAPTMADAQAVTDLICACDIAEYGSPDWTYDETLEEWSRDRFNLETDAWVVEADGQIVGYINAWERGEGILMADGYTHLDYRGQGIGAHLIELSEAWAKQHVSAHPKKLQNATYGGNVEANRLFEQHNYELIRKFWRMRIELDAPKSPAPLPVNISIRACDPEKDMYAIYQASDEAFRDHWQHISRDFETWKKRRIHEEKFDPSLWFIAWYGEEVAGVALCKPTLDGIGEVSTLGVRRPWRKLGVGMALLYHAFNEFYARDRKTVVLGVDSANPTGATRLYERAGMSIERQYAIYNKPIL